MVSNELRIAMDSVRQYGATHLKVEFEAEGASSADAEMIAEIASTGELGLVVKIGGCEAVRDIRESLELGADSIVAPMIESTFAASKFERAITNEVAAAGRARPNVAFNMESVGGLAILPDLLNEPVASRLDRVVLGRTDLTDSLRLTSADIESEVIEGHARRVFTLAREVGMSTTLGGTITPASVGFIERLDDLVDSFETRKVVYAVADAPDLKQAIEAGVRFELAWLRFKADAIGGLSPAEVRRTQLVAARIGAVE